MENDKNEAFGYRWIVLLVFSLISAVIQIQWLTFAPIAREARAFYHVSALQIDFLSLLFMAVYIIVGIPASFIIDIYGIRVGVGIGAVLTGLFGLLKGLLGDSYTMVVIAQIMIAVGQPFIINAATKVASVWFPIHERATAVGIATLAQFVGIIVAMIFTPMLVPQAENGNYLIRHMLMLYGIISFAAALLLLVFLREKPPIPPDDAVEGEKLMVLKGFWHILKQRDMQLILVIFFIGLGMFNAISTVIDQICQAKGLTVEQTGLVGGMMLIAGILGALILPALSDKFHKRKMFIIIGVMCMTPGLIGLTVLTNYLPLLFSAFTLGFFLLGAGAPVGFQYSAEVSSPAPESISQGMLLFIGQVSGILFILGMNSFGMIPSMVVFIFFAFVTIFLSFLLKESAMMQTEAERL